MSENFEKQVKHMLDAVQLDPQPAVWQNVRSAIGPGKRKRPFIFWWLLPIALVAGGLVYFITNNNTQRDITKVNSTVSQVTITGANTSNSISVPQNSNGVNITRDNKRLEHSTAVKEDPLQYDAALQKAGSKNRDNSRISTGKKQGAETNSTSTVQTASVKAKVKDDASKLVTTPVNKTVVDTGSEMTVAKSTEMQKIPPQQPQKADTANKVDVADKKNGTKRSKWSFGVTADAGSTKLTQGGLFSFGHKALLDASVASIGNPAGSFTNNTYQKSTTSSNASYGIYFTANRELGKRTAFQSSFGFRYQSFSVVNSIFKDTTITGSLVAYPVTRTSIRYKFTSLDLYAGVAFKIIKMNELNIGWGAGLDNQFLLSTSRHESNETLLYNLSSSQNNTTSVSGYNRWQPLLRFQLTADLDLQKRQWLKFSPYFQYGLRKFEKSSASSRDHLTTFGISATYFFR